MPYIADTLQQTEEEKKKKAGNLEQTGDISVSGSPSSVSAGVSPVATQASTAGKLGTGMKGTSAQKYVQAHQEPKLAEKITGKLQEEETGLATKTATERSDIETKTGFGLDQDNLKQIGGGEIARIQKVQQDLPGLYEKNAADIRSYMDTPEYQEYLTAKQGGFNTYESQALPTLKQDVNAFQQKAGLGTSEAGRFQLLREMFSRPDKTYTTGQQSLDQLLLQSKQQEKQALEDYSKIAGTDVSRQLTDLEKLQQLAKGKTLEEIEATKSAVTTGAEQAFGNIETNVVEKLKQYNTNKNKVSELYTKLLSGQAISSDEQNFLRQNTSGEAADKMLNIANNLSYQGEFGTGVEGRWNVGGTSAYYAGKAPGEAESSLYNYGTLDQAKLAELLNTANIGESLAEKSRFATSEEVAKQQALEELFQDQLGSNLSEVEAARRLQANQVGLEGLGVSNLEKEILDRQTKTNKTKEEEALEASTSMNQWYYDVLGERTGYGFQPGDKDATTASYQYLNPNNEWINKSDNEIRVAMDNDPAVTRLFPIDRSILNLNNIVYQLGPDRYSGFTEEQILAMPEIQSEIANRQAKIN